MKPFLTLINDFQSVTNGTTNSILDAAMMPIEHPIALP